MAGKALSGIGWSDARSRMKWAWCWRLSVSRADGRRC